MLNENTNDSATNSNNTPKTEYCHHFFESIIRTTYYLFRQIHPSTVPETGLTMYPVFGERHN